MFYLSAKKHGFPDRNGNFFVFKQNVCLYPRISLNVGSTFDFATGDNGKILLLPPPPTESRRLLEITEKTQETEQAQLGSSEDVHGKYHLTLGLSIYLNAQ